MGKRQPNNAVVGTAQNIGANAAADKKKKGKAKKPVNPDSAGGGVQGPVPVRKVPSFRGKNQLGLYAAGGMARAPSPGRLPPPPISWTPTARPPRP